MDKIVTGSVAESVAPTEIASTKLTDKPSRGILVHTHRMRPSDIAEMNVPAKANVNILPMLRKKLAYAADQLLSLPSSISLSDSPDAIHTPTRG